MMVCLSNQKKLIKDGLNLFGQYFVQGYTETCYADSAQNKVDYSDAFRFFFDWNCKCHEVILLMKLPLAHRCLTTGVYVVIVVLYHRGDLIMGHVYRAIQSVL